MSQIGNRTAVLYRQEDGCLTADAAVLLSEGKTAEAHKLACEAIKALPKAQFPGFAIAAKDWLDAIADAAQHGRSHIETSALAAATGL